MTKKSIIEIIDPDPLANTELFLPAVQAVMTGEVQECEYINIIFLDSDALRQLKKEYFNLDVYTDVISFNLNEFEDAIEGELYLSYEQISQNADQFETSAANELLRVLIHGCLHLCGYEDDTGEKKTEMTALENKYLAAIGVVEK